MQNVLHSFEIAHVQVANFWPKPDPKPKQNPNTNLVYPK